MMKQIWDFLKAAGFNDYAVAGIMGNIDAESGLRSNNLQDTYAREFGMSDAQYTAAVDSGEYTNFVNDKAGYGLCQWTYHTRKQKLYNLAKAKNKSISDINVQLELLLQELKGMVGLYNTLKNATSVRQASDAFMLQFENPYDKSEDRKKERADFGMVYYNKFAKQGGSSTMGVKTYQESDKVQLSEHFNSYEFRCGLGRPCACTTILIDDRLVEILEQIREHFGKPITITSAYRCDSYNRSIGGAVGSRHSKGQAADIVVQGISPREVAKYAESIGVLGIGLYETQADGFFTHIDTRDYKSFWYGQNEAKRTTFGGSKPITTTTTSSKPVVQENPNRLAFGAMGEATKQLQEDLNSLGFDCGDADGIFGTKTKEQVIAFQRKYDLEDDGIAGPLTLAKIKAVKSTPVATKPITTKVKVTASLLNIRSGPSIKHEIIGRLPRHAIVEIKDKAGDWALLTTGGYIHSDYIQEVK